MDNYMELRLPAESKNEAFARNVIAAFCVELNPTVDEIDDVKTVVSEAVTNCIVHAYADKKGEIILRAAIDGRILHMEIEDSGVGIKNIDEARQPYGRKHYVNDAYNARHTFHGTGILRRYCPKRWRRFISADNRFCQRNVKRIHGI